MMFRMREDEEELKIDNARERRERGGAWKEDKSTVRKSLMKKSLEI